MAKKELDKATELKNWLNSSHKKFEKTEEVIKRGLDYYRGKHEDFGNYQDFYVENQIFNNVDAIASAIIYANPSVKVRAKKKPYINGNNALVNTVEAAKAKAVQLNYYIKHLRLKRQIKKALVDALVGVWGIIYSGYTVKTEKINKDGEIVDPEEFIKEESPFSVRLSPLDFRKDPGSKDHELSDSNRIAIRWIRKLEDIKSNKSYKNTKDLTANFVISLDEDETKGSPRGRILSPADGNMEVEGNDEELVMGWMIWDKREKKIYDIVENHDKVIRDRKWPWDLGGGFPVDTLFFHENPDGDYPISSVEQYIDMQDILNEMNSAMMAHVRKVSQRKFAAKNSIPEAEMLKLERGGDGTIIKVPGNVREAVAAIQDGNISQDYYLLLDRLRNTIAQLSNVPEMQKGGAKNFETAEEPKLLAQGISSKRADRRLILEDFVVRVVSTLDKIIQQTVEEDEIPLSEEEFQTALKVAPNHLVKLIVGNQVKDYLPWLRMDKDSIVGEYEYDITPSSMSPVSDEELKQDTLVLANLLANNPYIDDFEATKRILDNFKVYDHAFLKDRDAVDKQMAQQAQAQQQALLAERQMKDQTDLQKTQMKNESAQTVAQINAGSAEAIQEARSTTDIGKELIKDSKEKPDAKL